MIVKLPFGEDNVAVDLRGLRVRPLQPSAPRGADDVGRVVSRAVDFPLDGPPLGDLARGRGSVVVVVPDATRRAQLPAVLPVIFHRLLRAGIEAHAISLLVASGTHPPVPESEVRSLVGELPQGVTLRQHAGGDAAGLVEIGSLRPGLPLRLDRHAVESELMITVGTVRHHYFAGFGGGPKMVFPGIAGHEEIQANHAQVLEREGRTVRRRPECEPGVLEGNPVAEEIARAVDLHPPGFSLCLVPGRDGGIARATAGPWRPAFEAAVELVRGWYEVAGGAFDHLVGCAGGPPGDSTLIQAHKALDAICRFANPGAEVMFVADLGGGAGSPAMDPFLEDPRAEAVLRRLADHYVQYGHTTLRIVEKTANHRIYLRSRLDPGVARRLGFIPVDDLDEIAERWRGRGVRDRVAVMSETPVWPKRQQPSTSS